MKSTKSVTFATTLVANTCHSQGLIGEASDVWWTADELAEIVRDCETLALVIESPTLSPVLLLSEEDCLRGLEAKTEEGAWARYKVNGDTCNAVIGEQEKATRLRKQNCAETPGGN